MLPTATQERFLAALPNTVEIRFPSLAETRRYTFATWWAHEDHDVEYPGIVCTLDPRGILRETDQPLDDRIRTEPNADDTIAYDEIRGHRLYDGLAVTVVDRGMSDGSSAGDRAAMMAGRIERWMRLEVPRSELATAGSYNEIPIHLPPIHIDGPADRSGMVDETDIARYEVSARIHYTLATSEPVDAVAETEVRWSNE